MKVSRVHHSFFKICLRILLAGGIFIALASMPQRSIRAAVTRLYVKPDGFTTGNCQGNWSNACTLQHALSLTPPADGYEVWVYEGTYKPTDVADRSATFQLKNKMALYGGFDGDEGSRADARPDIDKTILSGDIGTVDVTTDNSYHVVTGNNTDATAVLDGFSITRGNADTNAGPGYNYLGGGMYNSFGNPTLRRITFVQNSAVMGGGMYNSSGSRPDMANITFYLNSGNSGGGMYNFNAYPLMNSVTFDSNSASTTGGGMMNNYCQTPNYKTMTGLTFTNNTAPSGGGMRNSDCDPIIVSSTFINNHANGGSGGGMENQHSSPTVTNVTFSGNIAASTGGGMENWASEPDTSDPWLTNVTFYGNTASAGNSIGNSRSNMVIQNSILWGKAHPDDTQIYSINSIPVVAYSVVQDGWPGEGNINADPRLGSLGTYQGNTQVYPLLPGSPAIDQGTSNGGLCPLFDQRGISRPQGLGCDMGAFESRSFTLAQPSSGSGDHQWAHILAAFTHPLMINVTGVDGDPVDGGIIFFSVPVSGASATPASPTATITGGQASMTFTANGIVGTYHLFFQTTGGAGKVDFHLSNMLTPGGAIIYLPAVFR